MNFYLGEVTIEISDFQLAFEVVFRASFIPIWTTILSFQPGIDAYTTIVIIIPVQVRQIVHGEPEIIGVATCAAIEAV